MFYVEVALLAIFGGALGGLISGLFGLGGGSVLVPLFLLLFNKLGAGHEVLMHVAIGTSLVLIIFSSLLSSKKHYDLDNIELRPLKEWLPFVIIGVIIAGFIFNIVNTAFLSSFFIIYLIFCALLMLFKKEHESEDEPSPTSAPTIYRVFFGIVTGFVSTLLGIGGGTITVPFHKLAGYPLKKAIGISAVTGFCIGLAAFAFMYFNGKLQPNLPKFSLGYINYLALLLVLPTMLVTAPLGAKLNKKLPAKLIKRLYVVVLLLLALAVFLIINLLPK